MKKSWLLLLLLGTALLSLPGCSSPGAWRESRVLGNAASALYLARQYDGAIIASRNGDSARLAAAIEKIEQLGGTHDLAALRLNAAEGLVRDATSLDFAAQKLRGDGAQKLQQQATQKYRLALKLAPGFASRDPQLLNALGYFLAERGSTPADWRQAEKLTRAALARWNELGKEASDSSWLQFSRANTRDSLAWALYRKREYSAALQQQLAAVDEARRSAPRIGEKVPAELSFHLAEIYRASGLLKNAAREYQNALQVEPQHSPSQRALEELKESHRLKP